MSVKHRLTKAKKAYVKKRNKWRRKLKRTHKNVSHNRRIKKDKRARNKAETLAKLPKSRWKRFVYYIHPGRAFRFWFSKRGLVLALKLTGVFIAVFIFIAISLFAYYRREIEADPTKLQGRLLEQTTKFYDNTGERVIYNLHGDTDRTWMELESISDHVEAATIAVEDKNFYNHGGFDFSGFARSVYYNIFKRGSDENFQGGSTITQQFVKNALLSNEQTITRKIKELILSLEIERLYTKDEILEFYLNQIPYGGTEYGVEAASQSFFDKAAADLTIAESAMLAALPQAPSIYSPYGTNTDLLIDRQQMIIGLMEDQGYITAEEEAEALEVDILDAIIPLEEKDQFKNLIAPHFVVEVQRQLEEEPQFRFSEQLIQSGLKVTTTLDYKAQKIANKAMRQNIDTVVRPANGRGSGDNAAAVVVDNDTGHVVAMVGSRDYNYPKYGAFNAALASRQPGSSFKPYTYAQLFYNERWGPDSVIYDTKTTFGDYKPTNFDFGYRGMITVRQALGESRNIPAVKAMHITGIDNTLDLARAMGNKSLGENGAFLGLSAALGAGEVKLAEHTQGYSTLARGGLYVPQVMILKVENSSGEVLYEWEPTDPERVLDEQNAWLITEVLKDDAARSRTFGYNNPRLVAPGVTHTVKTGTTNEATDGWMMGYSAYYSVGVWAGNHDNTPMDSFTSWQTGPIFTQIMRDMHSKLDDKPIFESRPAGIKSIKIDSKTGYAADDDSKKTRSGLFPSWHVKQLPSETGASYVIDTVSGNLATECTPDLAREEVSGSSKWPEILPDDIFFSSWSKSAGYSGASGAAPEEEDDVHKCSDSEPIVSIDSIDENGGGSYTVNVSVSQGTHPLDELVLSVEGNTKTKNISSAGTYSFDYDTTSTGTINFTVRVIDELLYSTSDNDSVNTGGSLELLTPNDGDSANNILFSWTSISAATNYQVCWDKEGPGGQTCADVFAPNLTYTTDLSSDSEYTAFVQAFDGISLLSTSPTKSFETD